MNDLNLKAKILRVFYYYEIRKDGGQGGRHHQLGKMAAFKKMAFDFMNDILGHLCCAGPMGRAGHVQREEDLRFSRDSILRSVQELLEEKRGLLYSLAGERAGRQLYRTHVQQWDYVLIYSQADSEKGLSVRRALEKTQFKVAGPWCLGLGSCVLTTWERLLASATAVVVLVSRSLGRERLLNVCFAEVLSKGLRVVPMLLEEVAEGEVSSELRALRMRQEVVVFRRGLEDAVRDVVRHTMAHERYFRELDKIDGVLRRLPQYLEAPETPHE